MNCAYHSDNLAVIQCNSCQRPLCAICDHRIKGFPHCQDCIVAGIELLQRQHQTALNSNGLMRNNSDGSPLLAVLLSLICPGLGAAYNGQNAKALAHFGVFVGLFQMAVLTSAALFVFGFIGMWLFAALDAFRTARAARLGYAPQADDLLARQLSGNALVWSISLIVLGTLFFSHTILGIRLPVNQFLPVLLIALGLYWLINYVQSGRTRNNYRADNSDGLPTASQTAYTSVNESRFRPSSFDN